MRNGYLTRFHRVLEMAMIARRTNVLPAVRLEHCDHFARGITLHGGYFPPCKLIVTNTIVFVNKRTRTRGARPYKAALFSRNFYILFTRTAFDNKPFVRHFADDMIRAGLLHRQKLLDDLTGHKGVVPQIVQHRIVLRFLLIGLSERTGVIHIWQGQGKRSICCIDLRFDLEILVILHDKPQTRSVCFNVF